jgi:hypothetical protein
VCKVNASEKGKGSRNHVWTRMDGGVRGARRLPSGARRRSAKVRLWRWRGHWSAQRSLHARRLRFTRKGGGGGGGGGGTSSVAASGDLIVENHLVKVVEVLRHRGS